MPETKKRHRAIKYRAYPTELQAVLFAKTFGCVRYIWNHMLGDANRFYYETDKHFVPTPAKYKNEAPFLKEVDSLALANTQLNLKQAFKNAFENDDFGFPEFKSKKKAKKSYTTNNQKMKKKNDANPFTIYVGKNFIHLPKVGNVKIKKHRSPKNGWHLKSATVEQTSSGDYYISVLYEFEESIEVMNPKDVKTTIGLDYSSPSFYIDNYGNEANYPRFYRKTEDKLAIEQQKLSKLQYDSKNYRKQQKKVAKVHAKIANQRRNFCHTLSTEIANQYDAVFVEDINLRGLAGSLHLGKSTNDNGFGMFRNMLNYKLEQQGKYFIKVEKHFASSQICSACGYKNPEVKNLDIREWTCPNCNTNHNRDVNSATNINNRGLELLLELYL